eukprot:2652684-Pleurochrysis_carterae.AAC.3
MANADGDLELDAPFLINEPTELNLARQLVYLPQAPDRSRTTSNYSILHRHGPLHRRTELASARTKTPQGTSSSLYESTRSIARRLRRHARLWNNT